MAILTSSPTAPSACSRRTSLCSRCGANLPRFASAEEDLPTRRSEKYLAANYEQACPPCGARVPDPSDLWCLECRRCGDGPAPHLAGGPSDSVPDGQRGDPGRHVAAAGPGPGAVAGGRGLRHLTTGPGGAHGNR